MNIQHIDTPDGNLTIKLTGEMDAIGCSKIRPDLEAVTTHNHTHIVLDIKHIEFIDSSGIGAIVFLFKRLKELNRTMEIIGVHGQPQELMKMLRIDSAIPITIAEEVNNLQGYTKCAN